MRCALCFQESDLRMSHIIPEFLYEPLYDEKHRYQLLSIVPDQGNLFKQKGLKEKLLCDSCEQKISVWEGYARQVSKGGVSLTARTVENVIFIEGIDYKKFKLFQLSILWRAGVSQQQFFEYVDLGLHVETLRAQLVDENPGSASRYSCVMFGLKYDEKIAADVIIQPKKTRLHGQVAYNFIFGGYLWAFVVANKDIPNFALATTLSESGQTVVQVRDIMEMSALVDFNKELARLGRMPRGVSIN